MVIVLVVRWVYLKERLDRIETQLAVLASTVAGMGKAAPQPVRPMPQDPMPLPVFVRPPEPPATAAPMGAPPLARDWEATVGANWLNKAGVLILVIGIALALRYSFTMLAPCAHTQPPGAASLIESPCLTSIL